MAGLAEKNIWIIANWKSNKTIAEALDWVSTVGPKLPMQDNLKIVVCPTFSALSEVKQAITVGNFSLMVGSQDLSPFPNGPYTGEESAAILKQFINLAIIGHSERRKNFNETDEMIAKKVRQALESEIIPLVCVQGQQTPVHGVNLIAYEPIFAIGTGNPDTPENANKVAGSFRRSADIEVLYGGSVTSENVKSFITMENINGVLVGNASLDPEEFIKIVEVCEE